MLLPCCISFLLLSDLLLQVLCKKIGPVLNDSKVFLVTDAVDQRWGP